MFRTQRASSSAFDGLLTGESGSFHYQTPSDTSQAMEFGILALGLFAVVHWLCDLGWSEVLSFAAFKGSQAFGTRSQKVISAICAVMLLGFGVKFVFDAAIAMIG